MAGSITGRGGNAPGEKHHLPANHPRYHHPQFISPTINIITEADL